MTINPASLNFKGENSRDEFKREIIANQVIKLLVSSIDISPMVIDGDWGTGKTEFCHKLINKLSLENKDLQTLYIDAFQADHADNPLMTVLSSVLTLIPEESQKNSLIKKALPVFRYGLATVGKAVVGHTLKQNAGDIAEGFEKSLQDAADKAIDASLKALLKDHEKAKENLQALQKSLADIAKSSPITIFIDELDRCRPDFAVQLLEVIKHTFNVEGLKFVLVTNTRQLKAAINHRYGNQVDSQRYLDKFVKYSFQLPDFVPGHPGRGDQMVLAASEHLFNLILKSAVLQDTALVNKENGVYGFANELTSFNSRSLREIETFVRHLEIYHTLSGGLTSRAIWGIQLLRIFGVYIFCFSPHLTYAVQRNKTDADEIANIFGIDRLPDYKEKQYRWSHTLSIAVMLTQHCHNGQKYRGTEPEEVKYWNDDREKYFRGHYPPLTDLYDPVRDAIFTLRLGMNRSI